MSGEAWSVGPNVFVDLTPLVVVSALVVFVFGLVIWYAGRTE